MEALPILTCERLNIMTGVPRKWSWDVNSIVACCHSTKLCAYAARDFRSQQYQLKWHVSLFSKSENKAAGFSVQVARWLAVALRVWLATISLACVGKRRMTCSWFVWGMKPAWKWRLSRLCACRTQIDLSLVASRSANAHVKEYVHIK